MDIVIIVASLIGFVALTLGTALFVAGEFSLTALERSTISDDVARRGDRRARAVDRAHRTLSFQLSGAQLGITITTLITGYIAEPVLAKLFDPILEALGAHGSVKTGISLAASLIIATSLSMVLGELVPKNLAIAKPLAVARFTSVPMMAFSRVFKYAITGLNGSANALVRRLGVEPTEELQSARSSAELAAIVRNSALEGELDADTARLVDRSLRFGDLTAEDLMTPRVRVESLEPGDTVRDLIAASSRTGHSRFLVADDGDLDNLIGVVHIKQAFTVRTAAQSTTPLRSLARPVTRVPDSLDGDALKDRISADGLEVCVVVDEYGGTAGIVTSEDLIEEILGNVTDEHDNEESEVARVGNGFRCAGLLRLDEVADAIGYRAPDGAYETLGGLVMFQLRRIPEVGDVVDLPVRETNADTEDSAAPQRWRGTVVRMDQRRVDQVWLTTVDEAAPEIGADHG
ncbi:hemolysin family protein [Gordonia humi]|uniref:CBS domain containing-hemolysin-like protein n=1 Tax=Gordonia humi TaxID=686429 RepID=A0A840F1Q3_9ACTN|nr:hemolysin family protein [Gordonia humi]MBB4136428.1 CBS domain containing-hemolysin-like protein [Gordonia humi]